MSSPRTTSTHRSRLARRLAAETATGYQTALDRVHQAAAAGMLPPRLDAAGLDQALRILLQQDMEYWGPAALAHPWPTGYHPLRWSLPAPFSAQADAAAHAASKTGHDGSGHTAASGVFDPSYLHELGVEATVDYAPDDELDFEEGEQDPDEDAEDADRDYDELDRWRRFVLADGPRPQHALPAVHLLAPETGADDRAGLLRALEREPRSVQAYLALADLALPPSEADGDGGRVPGPALAEALAWCECAIAVGELALPMVFTASLPWQLPENHPFLTALYRFASLLRAAGRLNAAELVTLRLLWLDPADAQRASALLTAIRRDLGLNPAAALDQNGR